MQPPITPDPHPVKGKVAIVRPTASAIAPVPHPPIFAGSAVPTHVPRKLGGKPSAVR